MRLQILEQNDMKTSKFRGVSNSLRVASAVKVERPILSNDNLPDMLEPELPQETHNSSGKEIYDALAFFKGNPN